MLLENFGHKNKFGKEIININAKSKYKVDWGKKMDERGKYALCQFERYSVVGLNESCRLTDQVSRNLLLQGACVMEGICSSD